MKRALAGMMLMLALPAGADPIPAAARSCFDCHGGNGASTQPDVPIIGGLSAFSMEENLFAFREGERPCRAAYYRAGDTDRPATDMCRIARELSDDDIVAVAGFFASQPFVPADQVFDAERAERGRLLHERSCHNCHGDGGSDPADHASILAGQWMNYLRMAFMHLRAGQRWMPKAMQARLEKLSDDDVEDLVHYYGGGAALHTAP
ncbi:MAG: c-type cytochrome [Gammaproteobacteria bacterium]